MDGREHMFTRKVEDYPEAIFGTTEEIGYAKIVKDRQRTLKINKIRAIRDSDVNR